MRSNVADAVVWILVADVAVARLFETEDGGRTLKPLRHLQHKRGRLKETELLSDKPGRIHTRGVATHVSSISRHTPAVESEARFFAAELAKLLEQEREQCSYDGLLIIAPPHFLGILNQELNKEVDQLVLARINKELAHLPVEEIREHIATPLELFRTVHPRTKRARSQPAKLS